MGSANYAGPFYFWRIIVDKFILQTPFGKWVVATLLEKAIRNHLGANANISIDKLEATYQEDENLELTANIKLKMTSKELYDLVKKI